MNKRRVVVTGLGIVSPVGNDVATAWQNVVAGNSGIGPITHFDASAFPTRIAGEVKGFDPAQYIPPKDIKKMDTFIHYGIAAGAEALKDSGLEITEANAPRIGVAVGAGIGGIASIERTTLAYYEGGPRKISPFFVPGCIINMASGNLAIIHGLKGPNIACVTACTTATHNIGLAMRMIQYGDADAMLTGGAEFSVTATAVGGFCSARAMSTRNDDPTRASRPWDKNRDGFVLSDGAGLLVLEEYEHAKARGARIYAEVVGYGATSDGYDMVAPSGEGAERCMRMALETVKTPIDYINPHATSTPAGDPPEIEAIRKVFGTGDKCPPISATKALTGHSLGATGVQEAIYSLLMMNNGFVCESANITELDPVFADMPIVRKRIDNAKLGTVLSNSFGFGGTNATLVFKRLDA